MARTADWSATIQADNGRAVNRFPKRTVIVKSSEPSGAASAAVRKYRRFHIEPGTRVEGYQIHLTRLPFIQEES